MPAPVAAPFLYILKSSICGAAGCGGAVGAAHSLLEALGRDWDTEGKDIREEYDWLPEAQAVRKAEAAGGLPGAVFLHPADSAHPAGIGDQPESPGSPCPLGASAAKAAARQRYRRGRRVARRPLVLHTLWAATAGGALGLVAGVPLAAVRFHLSAAAACLEGAKAAAFWTPLWIVEGLFVVSVPITALGPAAAAVAHVPASQGALISGLRVTAYGQGAVFIFAFVNRYSTVQWSKEPPTAADMAASSGSVGSWGLVRHVNTGAVVMALLIGNAAAGTWLGLALLDTPGITRLNPVTWLPCYAYILVTQVHLAAPLKGHDATGSTGMLRTAFTGLASAAIAVGRTAVAPAAAADAIRCIVFACFAGWLGTFTWEWHRLQRRSMRTLMHFAVGRCTDRGLLLLYLIKWARFSGRRVNFSDEAKHWEWPRAGWGHKMREAVFGRAHAADEQEEIGGTRFGEAHRDWL
eukprot:TRINITY_DN25039_c0_g1_i1.p1 TRINITY_DN25039_c0_g1~~TRINITY_DN25039_c0_g1_i1.p1  ORF type:complete len:501 (+),score=128.45 TRINITY_DN25039_c0_g1_i1:109-1503(+)